MESALSFGCLLRSLADSNSMDSSPYLLPALVVVLLVLLCVVRVLDELLLRVDVETDSVRVPRPVRVDVWVCVVCVVEPLRPEVTVPLLLLLRLLICGEFLLPLTSR